MPWYEGKGDFALFEVIPKKVTIPCPTSMSITKKMLVSLS